MDIIDRYLQTLRMLLPRIQRDDIIRELSEEIEEQVAAKEAALGRRLGPDEQAAIVAQYGHPLLTAARYRPQRHLIGPVVFPYYWNVLKVALALVGIGHVLGGAVLLAGGASLAQIGQLVESAAATALKFVGWLTALGALADIYLARSRALENWRPPAVPAQPSTSRLPLRQTDAPISRLVTSIVLSAWWLAGLRFPFLFLGSGATGLEWGDAMDRVFPVLVIAQLTMLAEQFARYFRPDNAIVFRVTRLFWLAAGAALVYVVATSNHQWMVWSGESATRANATVMRFAGRNVSLVEFVNFIWSAVFIGVAILSVFGFLKAVLTRLRRTPMKTATGLI